MKKLKTKIERSEDEAYEFFLSLNSGQDVAKLLEIPKPKTAVGRTLHELLD